MGAVEIAFIGFVALMFIGFAFVKIRSNKRNKKD